MEPESDDSDFEFDGVRTKKVKSKKQKGEKKITAKPPKDPTARRRTHADSIPDSEKPFACDRKYNDITIVTGSMRSLRS